MKKIKLLLLILIGLFIIPNVHAASDVKITSVDSLEQSESTEVITPATFKDLTINFDVRFVNLKDYIKYKVVVSNDSDKDYRIINNTSFSPSKYIKYDYSYNNNNSIVKAHSKQTMIVTITYENQVPVSAMNADGSFTETNKMIVDLSRRNIIVNNPKTSNTIMVLLMVITLIVCISSVIGIKRRNKVTTMLLIIGLTVFSLPISILAIEGIRITLNSKVTISTETDFCVYDLGLTGTRPAEPFGSGIDEPVGSVVYDGIPSYNNVKNNIYKYKIRIGMTWDEFENSKYYNQVGNETPKDANFYENEYSGRSTLYSYYYYKTNNPHSDYVLEKVTPSNEVSEIGLSDGFLPCDQAIYFVKYDGLN